MATKKTLTNEPSHHLEKNDVVLKFTLEKLEKQFPGKTLLDINETAQAYNFKSAQSIYNALRDKENMALPKPIKRCGRWYWNIVHIATDQASQ